MYTPVFALVCLALTASLTLTDRSGAAWTYHFAPTATAKKDTTTKVRLQMYVGGAKRVGEAMYVRLTALDAEGRAMTEMYSVTPDGNQVGGSATIELTDKSGKVIGRDTTCFRCGKMWSAMIRTPKDTSTGEYTMRATLDTGPLAGKVTAQEAVSLR
jgi:hypothetical protein